MCIHRSILLITALLYTAINVVNAEPVLTASELGYTENGVVMPDGRYFVAGNKGIFEIKRAPDTSSDCTYSPDSGLTACLIVSNKYENAPGKCFFSGMTTDGTYLYAACAVAPVYWATPFALTTALYRILPNADNLEVIVRPLKKDYWYNGMVMLDENTLLVSLSQTGSGLNFNGPLVQKITITDRSEFSFDIQPWLDNMPGVVVPNGLAKDQNVVYFIGGRRLFRIEINPFNEAGEIEMIYKIPFHKIMDDLTVLGDQLLVTDHAIINGLGKNYITVIDADTNVIVKKISTERIQLSSLAIDKGLLFQENEIIGTSFFSGGLHKFSMQDDL